MFRRSRAIYAHIPCPALSQCRAPRCLFNHSSISQKFSDASTQSVEKVSSVDSARKRPAQQPVYPRKLPKRSISQATTKPLSFDASLSVGSNVNDANDGPGIAARQREPLSGSDAALVESLMTSSSSNRAAATLRKPVVAPENSEKILSISDRPSKRDLLNFSSQSKSKSPIQHISPSPASRPATDPQAIFIWPIQPNPPAIHGQRLKFAAVISDVVRQRDLSSTPNYDASCKENEIARSTTSATYVNTIKHYIISLKKMSKLDYEKDMDEGAKRVKKGVNSLGKIGSLKISNMKLSDRKLLDGLQKLVHTADKLAASGFMVAMPTADALAAATAATTAAAGYETCDRCTKHYKPDGLAQSDCIFHWAKPFTKISTENVRVKTFPCCGEGAGESRGCRTHSEHVYRVQDTARLANLIPYLESYGEGPSYPEAVSLDCEMGYTTLGTELIRVTILSYPSHELLYDTLVRPIGRIVDLNTQFSGVASLDRNLDGSEVPSFGTVRRLILSTYIGKNTVMLGHGLENDLAAMRILHTTVVDSSILYPHENPRLASIGVRMSLRNLSKRYLDRSIQQTATNPGDKIGHDSWEDAKAAADLITQKVFECS
ncbi:uncharacterized protein V2V93DRAFT_373722 [Kockiozyma suomiensis]|uniref:uncharacterized protein n=1 Tax=Kockiozyma suomiensis TaxID=1337062 RepID=UPI003343D44D